YDAILHVTSPVRWRMPMASLGKQNERATWQYEMRTRFEVDSRALLRPGRCSTAIKPIVERYF
ncbi:MAG TPA: hypothetical protein VK621_20610, partial [Bradyrhizobium sp.]|nr:hypothetical protein [Bradyrhizobium sp.]